MPDRSDNSLTASCHVGYLGEARVHVLARFSQHTDQRRRLLGVALGEERVSGAGGVRASGAPDAVDVVLGTVRVVKVYDKFHIFHI